MLDDTSFQSQISPFIVTLFQLNDRGIRAALLNRLPSLTDRLDKQAINSCVFEPMCTGFTDSSAALREMTLKSTLPLISKLNSVNIEKLGRYLIRLQSDSEDSIRTNTVIFISKVSFFV
jgi:SCY1-like protein 1